MYPKEVLTYIERYLNILRLYKDSSISVVHQVISPFSVYDTPVSENIGNIFELIWKNKIINNEVNNSTFVLKKNEEEQFKSFA